MAQALLDFDSVPRFNGSDYSPSRDNARLTGQILRVFNVLSDGEWWTLREIARVTGDPEASISAQIRHPKKERFGSHPIEKRHRGEPAKGLYEYRMLVAAPCGG